MMPEGWMIDRTGAPLLDPKRADEGFLVPIGGYKGYGLSMIIGLLAGTLNSAANGRDVVDFNSDNTTPTNTGHVIVAINVANFRPLDEFKQAVDAFVRDIRNSQRLPGVDAIRLPGEQSHVRLADNLRLGVPLSGPLVKALNDLAGELKIPLLN
jgi:LDH2 family malate/lactate/ureidoglycolate dehydrogenase